MSEAQEKYRRNRTEISRSHVWPTLTSFFSRNDVSKKRVVTGHGPLLGNLVNIIFDGFLPFALYYSYIVKLRPMYISSNQFTRLSQMCVYEYLPTFTSILSAVYENVSSN